MEHTFISTHSNQFFLDIERKFISMIRSYVPKGEKVILGYSGGPDSEALLLLFLSTLLSKEYELHIVHVDHGWREESKKEAHLLEEKCRSLGLVFHLARLDPECASGNLENWCRSARFDFFKSVANEIGSCWILLGHQQDDSIEVTFKRVMEGSHLVYAKGIEEHTVREGLHILRPLLGIWKSDLIRYLSFRKSEWLEDRTNKNTHFLRAAMREILFPMLQKHFRKDVRHSLVHIAQEAKKLHEHIQECLEEQCSILRTKRAVLLKRKNKKVSSYVLSYALLEESQALSGSFHREQIEKAISHFLKEDGSAHFTKDGCSLYVDRHSLLLLQREILPPFPPEYSIEGEGEYTIGLWQVSVEKSVHPHPKSEMLDLFNDGYVFETKSSSLSVVPATDKNRTLFKKRAYLSDLSLYFPASLRKSIPLFVCKEEVLASPNTYMVRLRCL